MPAFGPAAALRASCLSEVEEADRLNAPKPHFFLSPSFLPLPPFAAAAALSLSFSFSSNFDRGDEPCAAASRRLASSAASRSIRSFSWCFLTRAAAGVMPAGPDTLLSRSTVT